MTSKEKVSFGQRFRQWLRNMAARLAPPDTTEGRQPLSQTKKIALGVGSLTALVAWGAVLIVVMN